MIFFPKSLKVANFAVELVQKDIISQKYLFYTQTDFLWKKWQFFPDLEYLDNLLTKDYVSEKTL